MIVGLILAGGKATRMNGADKAMLSLLGKPLIAHVAERLAPQVAHLAISANGDPARFKDFALPVLADPLPGFPGPLAGLLAGLEWAQMAHPGCRWLLSAPCDAPFLPLDLAARLEAAAMREGAELAMAASQGSRHPVIALWPVSAAKALRGALTQEDLRKVGAFAARFKTVAVDFPPTGGRDPFLNLNTPEELTNATSR